LHPFKIVRFCEVRSFSFITFKEDLLTLYLSYFQTSTVNVRSFSFITFNKDLQTLYLSYFFFFADIVCLLFYFLCRHCTSPIFFSLRHSWFLWSHPISVKKRSFSCPVSLLKSLFFSPIIILFLQYSHKRSSHGWALTCIMSASCLIPLSTIFQFYWWRKPEYRRKPPTCRKSLTNFIT
jgi:hypothetical protein